MSRNWKNILSSAGDQNIGATLIRLARMAEAVHRFEEADAYREENGRPEELCNRLRLGRATYREVSQ